MIMSEKWVEIIGERLAEYRRRREELNSAYIEVVDELKRVIPNQEVKCRVNVEVPIMTFVEIDRIKLEFSEEEIWKAQKVYGADNEGNVVETGKKTAKDAIIELILDKCKWISGQ